MKYCKEIDQTFDWLLVFSPTVFLLNLDTVFKATLIFYIIYLPYVVFSVFKMLEQKRKNKNKNIFMAE